MRAAIPRPDFAVFGAQMSDGKFMVMASRTLLDLELRAEYEIHRMRAFGSPLPELLYIEVSGRVRSYHMAVGDSYMDALTTIIRAWDEEDRASGAAQRPGLRLPPQTLGGPR